MPAFDVGLQHRVRRLSQQIADQHRNLASLRAEIDAAFARGTPQDVARELKRYEFALAAHFDLEQGFFFPALHGLDPARSAALEALEGEHARLLARLRAIADGLASRSPEASRGEFARWDGALRDHELREEALAGAISGHP